MSTKKENKQLHLLIENSVNKDILFNEEGLKPFLFHTHLIKMFKEDNFNFDKMFKLSSEYEFNNLRKNLTNFMKNSPEWKKFKEGDKDIDMIKILRKYLDKRFTMSNMLDFISKIANVPIPFLVKKLLEFFSEEKSDPKDGLIFAFSIIGLLLLTKILSHASFHGQIYTQIMSKYLGIVMIISYFNQVFVTGKVFNMPPGAEKSLDLGKITSLITVDSNNLGSIMSRLIEFIVKKII